jgi:hypothetical protein
MLSSFKCRVIVSYETEKTGEVVSACFKVLSVPVLRITTKYFKLTGLWR